MTTRHVLWRPGFFTSQLHATLPQPDRFWRFRSLPITWGLCGAPTAAIDITEGRNHCASCAAIAHRITKGLDA